MPIKCFYKALLMYKKIIFLTLASTCQLSLAITPINLHHAPLDRIKQFTLIPAQSTALKATSSANASVSNALQQKNKTLTGNQTITRYQQLYKGIPVVGAEIMVRKGGVQGVGAKNAEEVNGEIIQDIQLNTQPTISSDKAIELAKSAYLASSKQQKIEHESSQLQIRVQQADTLQLVYLVSFKTIGDNGKPLWPFFIVDAQTGVITKQWNNIKTIQESGPGGNEKVQEYWYGLDGLPSLNVNQVGQRCIMDSNRVKLVNVKSAWDWDNKINTPFEYPCGQNSEDKTNGAFSPSNDAYYFGHTIVDMYKDWYGVHALQNRQGEAMKLVMRVHFGKNYDNAFWDGQAMSFGDGEDFYPLVSLDVAGHEVTHGFTEQHSDLEYHDESGALNESISDMAGQAARAYLLEKYPALYNKSNLTPDVVTWGIGETITRDSFGKALRFMDFPSSDGSSADCLDKKLARSSGAYCAISYEELVAYAKATIHDPDDQQSFIVHTGSGVFNKAFYLMANELGIKKAYQAMIVANTNYWTPTTGFKHGACGVVNAAKDLAIDLNVVKSAFNQVGVDTTTCVN